MSYFIKPIDAYPYKKFRKTANKAIIEALISPRSNIPVNIKFHISSINVFPVHMAKLCLDLHCSNWEVLDRNMVYDFKNNITHVSLSLKPY